MTENWTLREAAAELGVTSGYLRQLVAPENMKNPPNMDGLEDFEVYLVKTRVGYYYELDKRNLELLRGWLATKSEAHKFRRISRA